MPCSVAVSEDGIVQKTTHALFWFSECMILDDLSHVQMECTSTLECLPVSSPANRCTLHDLFRLRVKVLWPAGWMGEIQNVIAQRGSVELKTRP